MPLVLRCAFPKQETSCVLKVLDWETSSSVFSSADHLFLKDQSVQASSMSSGGTLSPRQQEGSYFEPWALCHSSRSLMVALRMAQKWQTLARRCRDVYPAATNAFLSRPPIALNGHYLVIYSHACRRGNKQAADIKWSP